MVLPDILPYIAAYTSNSSFDHVFHLHRWIVLYSVLFMNKTVASSLRYAQNSEIVSPNVRHTSTVDPA